MENITPYQQKLVEDLVKEFTNINNKSQSDNKNRFGFNTISECKKEEERFVKTLTKHNLTMVKVYINKFKNDIKTFEKEFGKVLNIQIGKDCNCLPGTFDKWVEANKEKPIEKLDYYEMSLFLVSKNKSYYSYTTLSYNYCNGKDYMELFVDFKREKITHELESGKVIVGYKIIGLEYRLKNYLHKTNSFIASTLDELVQNEKTVQEKIVELVK